MRLPVTRSPSAATALNNAIMQSRSETMSGQILWNTVIGATHRYLLEGFLRGVRFFGMSFKRVGFMLNAAFNVVRNRWSVSLAE